MPPSSILVTDAWLALAKAGRSEVVLTRIDALALVAILRGDIMEYLVEFHVNPLDPGGRPTAIAASCPRQTGPSPVRSLPA